MALTVLSHKDYKNLVSGLTEENDDNKKVFKYDEMLEHAENFQELNSYLKTTNIKYVGEGSSRVAFFIPPGSLNFDKSRPTCLKIAKTAAGIAQNRAEINIFNKYKNKYECFPTLYDYDKSNSYFVFTEVGEAFSEDDDSTAIPLVSWSKKWDFKMKDENIDEMLILSKDIAEDRPLYNTDVTEGIVRICDFLNDLPLSDSNRYINKLETFFKSLKKYSGIISLMDFAINGGMTEVMFSDFEYNIANWAFVTRNYEDQILIPIDFGFTPEVVKKYY